MLNKNFLRIFNNIRLNSTCTKTNIHLLGIQNPKIVYHNLSYSELLNHEIKNKEGELLCCEYGDTFSINTGKFTGRSPNDKWIVNNENESGKDIWWGNVNKPITNETFDYLYNKSINHFIIIKMLCF